MCALVPFVLGACQAYSAPFDPPTDARVMERLSPVGGETRVDFVIVKNGLCERRWECVVFYKSTVRALGAPATRDVARATPRAVNGLAHAPGANPVTE